MNATGSSSPIWGRMRLTPPAVVEARRCVALVRYDPGFAAWQIDHDEVALALQRWKRALMKRNPRLKLSRVVQAELPI